MKHRRLVLATAALVSAAATEAEAAPGECRTLRYVFQPDCFRSSLDSQCDKRKTGDRLENARLDLGPQIAVWIESADGTAFVDTLMVTNLTAVRGLGNRPGVWKLPSSPKFPYGKRPMALPIWAHRRGKLYDTVVMQDQPDKELWLGFHELYSSPDPYYCRPMSWAEIDVDAVSCPTKVFNSVKGRISPGEPKSRYPPRNDIVSITERDCDEPSFSGCASGRMSVARYADINDLDAVAAATPQYGQPHRGVWNIPSDLVDGDYALIVEVNKEFDNNASHGYPAQPSYQAHQDPSLTDSGLRNNFGQPSVVFRVPIRVERRMPHQASVTEIAGYGDWNGATGALHARDRTISDAPGSGEGRLLAISDTGLGGAVQTGRVLVTSGTARSCDPGAGGRGEIARLEVPGTEIEATAVVIRFAQADDGGIPVEQYEIRFREGETMTPELFAQGTPAPVVLPGPPGASASFRLAGLKPATQYVLGVRARGCCIGVGPLQMVSFTTSDMRFTQLSGCFVATAAYGSTLAPQVESLRRLRDRVRADSGVVTAAVGLYERASPPIAAVLQNAPAGRALVRAALGPLLGALEVSEKVSRSH